MSSCSIGCRIAQPTSLVFNSTGQLGLTYSSSTKANPNNPDAMLVQKLVRELKQDGTLDVLRHGFKLPRVKIEACSFKPDHSMNSPPSSATSATACALCRRCLTRRITVRGSYNPRLDLVLFVNGITAATLALKS